MLTEFVCMRTRQTDHVGGSVAVPFVLATDPARLQSHSGTADAGRVDVEATDAFAFGKAFILAGIGQGFDGALSDITLTTDGFVSGAGDVDLIDLPGGSIHAVLYRWRLTYLGLALMKRL